MSIKDEQQITDLPVDTMVLIEEVKDGIAENLFNQLTLTEIDTVIQRLEILRQQLRRRSLQIGTTELPINNTLTSIKDYIMAAKDFKTKTRFLEKKSKDDVIQQQQLSIIVHQIEQICCGSKLMHHSKFTRSRQINLYLSRKVSKMCKCARKPACIKECYHKQKLKT